MTIVEPSQNPNKTDADAAWEKETTDALNRIAYQVEGLGSGAVASDNRILVYATDASGSDMSYEQRSLSGFSAVLPYSGDLPTLPISGLVFSPFSDTAVNTTIKQYIRTNTVQTSAPSAASGYNTRTGEWSSSVGWQKTIPQADNVPTWVCHAVISGSGTNVTISWTNPTLFYSNNRATGVVYYTEPQQATPSKPTATDFSFTTFVMTFGAMESGVANKWQQQPFKYDVTNTVNKQYTCEYIAEKHPGSNTATVTFSSPRGYVGIADDLQSNNYQAGQDGWKIKRDDGFAEFGSAVIRGTLAIGQIPPTAVNGNISIASNGTLSGAGGGSVSASGIGAVTPGELSAGGPSGTVINGDRITTGTLNVNRIGNNSIGMTQIATTLQSTPFSSGSQGWRIQNSGAAEFNNVVISRNQQVAGWTEQIPNMAITQGYETTFFNIMVRHEIPLAPTGQQIGLGNWGGSAENTYTAAAHLDGNTEVHFQGSPANHRPLVMFGVTIEVLPLGQASGFNQTFRFRINVWGRYCWGLRNINPSATTFPCYIRVYKLT